MAVNEILVLLMFVATFGCLLAGFPVAFTLSGVALLFVDFGLDLLKPRKIAPEEPEVRS